MATRPLRTAQNDANLKKASLRAGNSYENYASSGAEGGTTAVNTKAGKKQISYKRNQGGFTEISVDGKKIGTSDRFVITSGNSNAEKTRKVASSYAKNYFKVNSK